MSEVKVGDVISADRFWVSETNMRFGQPFGESEEDRVLIEHFRRTGVVQPFKARPENWDGREGYGVYVGRRRFLAMKAAGFKEFAVGVHAWIEDLSEDEAREASLKENLEEFQRAPDPITRAEAINAYMSRMPSGGVRRLARSWSMPASTLSEYLKVLELASTMREAVRRGFVTFKDGLLVVRLKLGEEAQNRLAEVAEESRDFFKRELARLKAAKGKRGIPKGKFLISRIMFDRRYKPDMELYQRLTASAEEQGKKLDEYCKAVLRQHVETLA